MKKAVLLALLSSLFMVSCSSAPQTKTTTRGASLSVTYYGKEIHRRGGQYVSERELRDLIYTKGRESFVIFSAPWCPACRMTQKAVKQANLGFDVHWVNLQEPWAKRLGSMMEIKNIPLLVHVGKDGKTKAIKLGPGNIIIYLLTRE